MRRLFSKPAPRTFKQAQKRLARIQSFDPKLLLDSDKEDRLLNTFVVSLSVILNDIKTLDLISSIHGNSNPFPSGSPKPKKELGAYNGISMYFIRSSITLICETMNKLDKKTRGKGAIFHEVVKTTAYKSVLKKMSPAAKSKWGSLIRIANGSYMAHSNNSLMKILTLIKRVRSKIHGHYDFQEIYQGYKYHFNTRPQDKFNARAMLSLGHNMWETRLFFADAAAEGYIRLLLGEKDFTEFERKRQDLLSYIMYALYSFIVTYLKAVKRIRGS